MEHFTAGEAGPVEGEIVTAVAPDLEQVDNPGGAGGDCADNHTL